MRAGAASGGSGEDAWASLCRVLRKRMTKLPKIDPPPDQVSLGACRA